MELVGYRDETLCLSQPQVVDDTRCLYYAKKVATYLFNLAFSAVLIAALFFMFTWAKESKNDETETSVPSVLFILSLVLMALCLIGYSVALLFKANYWMLYLAGSAFAIVIGLLLAGESADYAHCTILATLNGLWIIFATILAFFLTVPAPPQPKMSP